MKYFARHFAAHRAKIPSLDLPKIFKCSKILILSKLYNYKLIKLCYNNVRNRLFKNEMYKICSFLLL